MMRTWLFAALACAIAAAILVSQQRQLAQLRAQNLSLREQLQQLQLLENQNQHPSNTIPQSDNPAPNSELLRLRAEVTMLHQQTNELARSLQENRRLDSAVLARQSPGAYASNALLATLMQQDPDALLHGTLSPTTSGWEYKGTNAGRQIWSFRAGPTN